MCADLESLDSAGGLAFRSACTLLARVGSIATDRGTPQRVFVCAVAPAIVALVGFFVVEPVEAVALSAGAAYLVEDDAKCLRLSLIDALDEELHLMAVDVVVFADVKGLVCNG